MDFDDIVREFLVESYENLDRLDQALVALETRPADSALLADIFRTIHTLKGTAGFLGFTKLEAISHVGESLLSALRDQVLTLTPGITSTLLRTVDAVRALLGSIEASGAEDDRDYSGLIADLKALTDGIRPEDAEAEAVDVDGLASDLLLTADVLAAHGLPSEVAWQPGDDERRSGEDRRAPADDRDRRQSLSESSLRVDVGLLDKLMNLVGELVLARNQIVQFTSTQSDSSFLGATQRLNLVTSELQEGVMKTRMQPIDNVWSKFPRLVRDLATACGKRVRIEMTGKDTDLDKTIIEAIKDPLTHVVRNAVDHGLESPEARIAAGKNPEGSLTLRAYHEGGHINIEIADDGGGINVEKVKARAIQRGLLTTEQAARIGDHDVARLIFLPGFSTADKVTNVSGRGVGMDVVKTNIEKIGGTIDVQSTPGRGTTLRIKIPLTLAIIPALMVATGVERFAIPQVSLLELVRLEGDHIASGIERIGSAAFHRLRGALLPLVYLREELDLDGPAVDQSAAAVNIVVLQADGCQFGLVVDAVSDTEEIVVKPLGRQLKGVDVFAGATIMGDGQVALILDVLGIAQRTNVVTRAREAAATSEVTTAAAADMQAEARDALLLFRVGERGRMAMPLAMVARLEEFPAMTLEQAGGRPAVQYRNEILPLVSVTRYFGGGAPGSNAATTSDPLQVIVVSEHGRGIGLIVDEILDIVTDSTAMTRSSAQPGILGSAVIQKRVTCVCMIRPPRESRRGSQSLVPHRRRASAREHRESVRGIVYRAGAVFARDAAGRALSVARRLAHPYFCDRPVAGRPRPRESRMLLADRSESRASDHVSREVFREAGRRMAARAAHPRAGRVPADESGAGVADDAGVRRRVHPQRDDLFRCRREEVDPRTDRPSAAARRLSVPRRGGDDDESG
jgi:two-component system chemotaxis sensor kinase CheA